MKIKIKIIAIVLLALLFSFIPYTAKETVITREFLAGSCIELFGVTLAIIALLFTVLDRYKERIEEPKKSLLEEKSFPVIKNMGDNIIGTLVLIIVIFLYDIFESFFKWLQKLKYVSYINVDRFVLLIILIFLIMITIDITVSIIVLINGLIKINKNDTNSEIIPSEKELDLISVSRKLDDKHFNELLEYIKTLSIKQEMDK